MRILVIDVGSSSVRACILAKHEIVLQHAIPLATVDPASGQLAIFAIMKAVEVCISHVLELYKETIEAVGMSSLVMNLVGVDEKGEVMGSDYTLSYASRQSGELREDLAKLNLQQLYKNTGCFLGSSSYALGALREGYATEKFRKVHAWHTISSVLYTRWLTAVPHAISLSEAAWTGLLNVQSGQWDSNVLNILPDACVSALPAVHESALTNSPLSDQYAQLWPALQTARWYLGIGDGLAATCGAYDQMACTIGTSAALRILIPRNQLPMTDGLFAYRVSSNDVLLGGALTDGGSLVEWITNVLRMGTAEFQECLEEIDTEVHDSSLTMLPFLSGERSTGFQSTATGAWLGLTRTTSRRDLLRSVMEGITLRLNAIAQLLPPSTIRVSGKALEANAVWRQWLADCTGMDVVWDPTATEATSRGVAYWIDRHVHGSTVSNNNNNEEVVCHPRPSRRPYWDALRERQDAFLEVVRPLYD